MIEPNALKVLGDVTVRTTTTVYIQHKGLFFENDTLWVLAILGVVTILWLILAWRTSTEGRK